MSATGNILVKIGALAAAGHGEAQGLIDAYTSKAIATDDFVTIANVLLEGQQHIARLQVAKEPTQPRSSMSQPREMPHGTEGFLFMASAKTFPECMRRSLFGETGRQLRAGEAAIYPHALLQVCAFLPTLPF